MNELKKLIMERGIEEISPIQKESFIEIDNIIMQNPLIIKCIINKAIKCFKYLLVNEIENPTQTLDNKFIMVKSRLLKYLKNME